MQDRFAEVDLRQVAGECVRALGQKAAAPPINVQVEGAGSVRGSATLLFEMFYNLISNRIKYNSQGGQVRVTISSGGGQTTVKVADNGIGIPLEDQHRIFERFYGSEKSRSKKLGGTGLGLAIVKHVVEYHQGRITVLSTPRMGTEFVITFGGE